MNIILVDAGEIGKDGRVVLEDRRSEHIIKILRSKCGDRVRIGVIKGSFGYGHILEIAPTESPGRVVLAVSADGPIPEPLQVDLILALPRPIMLKRILVQVASLGVGRIFLINANRVEKSYYNASLLKNENYRQYLLHGLEQAMDTRMPEIFIHNRFRPFVEDWLPKIINDYSCKLIAHPTASKFLFEISPNPAKGRVLLAIGPEGGWVDFELEKFQQISLQSFSMGPRILRVDTAVPALLSQIILLRAMN